MANNLPVTPGSGANVATDQLGDGTHVQLVKLVDGTEDGEDRLAGTAANGLQVDVTQVQGSVDVVNAGTFAVQVDSSVDVNVTNSGTFAVQADTELEAASVLADAVANPTSSRLAALNLLYNGSTWDRVRGDTANGLDVDVTRVSGTVTVDSELETAAALADATANPTSTRIAALGMLYNGTTWDRLRGDIANGLDVDVTRVSGTVTVDSELTTGDLDTGGGTDTRAVVGVVLAGSGGGALLPGDATNGLKAQITTQPALVKTTDAVASYGATDAVMDGATALVPKFAPISVASSGNNTVVSAVSSKKIRVLSVTLSASGVVTAKFQSGAGGTDLSGPLYLDANRDITVPYSPVGHFETAATTLLNINLSGAVSVGGFLTYIEV